MIPFIDAAALFDFIDVELTRTWKPDYSGGKFSQYSMDMRKLAKIQDLRGEGEKGRRGERPGPKFAHARATSRIDPSITTSP